MERECVDEPLSPGTPVDELLTRHPAAARVFIRHRMHCVGCDMSVFETIEGACRVYGQPLGPFMDDLRSAIHPGSGGRPAGRVGARRSS